MNAILPRPAYEAYEDSVMQINFPNDDAAFDGANLLVRFTARVDGEAVVCAITAEALEDHFGADSALEGPLMAAFDKGRQRIRSVCAEALDQNNGEGVVLHSGLFRVEGMESDRGATA
jgi:hypothetical protein